MTTATRFTFKPIKKKGAINSIIIKGAREDAIYIYFDGQEDRALTKIKEQINAGKVVKLGDNKQIAIGEAYLLPPSCPTGLSREQQLNRLTPYEVAQVDKLDEKGEVIESEYFTKSLKPIDACRFVGKIH